MKEITIGKAEGFEVGKLEGETIKRKIVLGSGILTSREKKLMLEAAEVEYLITKYGLNDVEIIEAETIAATEMHLTFKDAVLIIGKEKLKKIDFERKLKNVNKNLTEEDRKNARKLAKEHKLQLTGNRAARRGLKDKTHNKTYRKTHHKHKDDFKSVRWK